MTHMNRILATLLLVFSFVVAPVYAQTVTTSTTFSTALSSTATAGTASQVCLTSSTGVSAPGFGSTPQTAIMAGTEYMPILASTPNANCWTVTRGGNGTKVSAHATTETVYVGPVGGNTSGPFRFAPPAGGAGSTCTSTSFFYLPQVVVGSGTAGHYADGQVWTCPASGSVGASTWQMTTDPGAGQMLTDGYFFVSPASCGVKATTTTTTDNGMVPVATGNVVHQFTTNATGGTSQITCGITVPSRLTSGKGISITSVSFLYGVQTNAIASIATAALSSVTYPTSTAGGAAAAGTVAAIGGTVAVTPTSLQLATTTTGQCYSENLTLGTPYNITTDNVGLSFDQVFTNSAAITVYQSCGLIVRYTNRPI